MAILLDLGLSDSVCWNLNEVISDQVELLMVGGGGVTWVRFKGEKMLPEAVVVNSAVRGPAMSNIYSFAFYPRDKVVGVTGHKMCCK